MREIKFRAWDKEKNRMYNGDEIEAFEDLNAWLSYGGLAIYRIEEGEYTELKPLQFTGLQDKNGVEIYEGDIVKYTFRDGGRFNSRYMVITNRDAGFKMKEIYRDYWLEKVDGKLTLKHGYLVDYKGELSNLHSSNLVYWTEVIGNIYENPELLEAEHE